MSRPRSSPPAPMAAAAGHARPLRLILALADFSPKSNNAVARAALLAREHGASLQLLHVMAPRRFAAATPRRAERDHQLALERAGETLATLAARIFAMHGVSGACNVRAGDALQAILDAARGADLVVVAAKRPNPLRDFVLRTPTERLLRIVQRPVLIVKRPVVAPYASMLAPAAEMSRADGPPTTRSDAFDTPRAQGALTDEARVSDELVVVAKDGHAAMCNFLLGRRAQRLVAHASCDVLLLPRADTDAAKRAHARERRPRDAFAIDAAPRVRAKTA